MRLANIVDEDGDVEPIDELSQAVVVGSIVLGVILTGSSQ